MKEMIGYDCQVSKLEDTEEWSKELAAKFREFAGNTVRLSKTKFG